MGDYFDEFGAPDGACVRCDGDAADGGWFCWSCWRREQQGDDDDVGDPPAPTITIVVDPDADHDSALRSFAAGWAAGLAAGVERQRAA